MHFNYFKDFSLWQRDETDYSAHYGAKDGIEVKKAANLVYDVSLEGKTSRFDLDDLSTLKPPERAISDERYLGPSRPISSPPTPTSSASFIGARARKNPPSITTASPSWGSTKPGMNRNAELTLLSCHSPY